MAKKIIKTHQMLKGNVQEIKTQRKKPLKVSKKTFNKK